MKDCYINGAYGGVTSRQEIVMQLFSERGPLPKQLNIEVEEDGSISKPGEPQFKADVIRLVQASLIMDAGTAKAIRDWLDDKIKYVSELNKSETKEAPSKAKGKKKAKK
jgi:hypothetical protein